MPSLFRIDKNSLIAESLNKASVVELPGFEDMIEQNREDIGESVEDAPPERDERQTRVELLQQQTERLEKQIEEAREQAKHILAEANAEAARVVEEAINKGYDEGYAQAMASVRQEQELQQRQVEDVVMALRSAKDGIYSQIEDSVLDLSLFIAGHIMKMELDRTDETFINIVRDTLSKVQHQNNIVIKVSKAEYERIFADQSAEISEELKNSGVEVKQDLSLQSGDCVVETEYGNINSGVRTQLKRMGYALREEVTEK